MREKEKGTEGRKDKGRKWGRKGESENLFPELFVVNSIAIINIQKL